MVARLRFGNFFIPYYSIQMTILITKGSRDYELLDSGDGKKLERFGNVTLSRPDPQVLWKKQKSEEFWNRANAIFEKKWNKKNIPESWKINLEGLSFILRPSTFKHVGIFPEQSENWKWIENIIKKNKEEVSVINLFGYTGGATLAALRAGAKVTHVDASKTAISASKTNAQISGFSNLPIRWILDDAITFLKREIKRGNSYNGIIMDPPAFGRGSKGEVWKIEKDFENLLKLSKEVLAQKPLFFLINGYASGYSSIAYENSLRGILTGLGGTFENGELTIEESDSKRLLPAGIFCRWNA